MICKICKIDCKFFLLLSFLCSQAPSPAPFSPGSRNSSEVATEKKYAKKNSGLSDNSGSSSNPLSSNNFTESSRVNSSRQLDTADTNGTSPELVLNLQNYDDIETAKSYLIFNAMRWFGSVDVELFSDFEIFERAKFIQKFLNYIVLNEQIFVPEFSIHKIESEVQAILEGKNALELRNLPAEYDRNELSENFANLIHCYLEIDSENSSENLHKIIEVLNIRLHENVDCLSYCEVNDFKNLLKSLTIFYAKTEINFDLSENFYNFWKITEKSAKLAIFKSFVWWLNNTTAITDKMSSIFSNKHPNLEIKCFEFLVNDINIFMYEKLSKDMVLSSSDRARFADFFAKIHEMVIFAREIQETFPGHKFVMDFSLCDFREKLVVSRSNYNAIFNNLKKVHNFFKSSSKEEFGQFLNDSEDMYCDGEIDLLGLPDFYEE